MVEHPVTPTLVNRDGESVVMAEARYRVCDAVALRSALRKTFQANPDGSDAYAWLKGEDLMGFLEVKDQVLTAQSNSRERLGAPRRIIEDAAGRAVDHQVDSFTDPPSAAARAAVSGSPSRPSPPPPELGSAITEFMSDHLRDWLDTGIPMLGDKTPRQAVRSKKGRSKVASLLADQERSMRSSGGGDVDFAAIWQELGLDYKGPFLSRR